MTFEDCRELMEAMRNDGEHGFVYDFYGTSLIGSPYYTVIHKFGVTLALSISNDKANTASIFLKGSSITPAAIRAAWQFMEGIREARERE